MHPSTNSCRRAAKAVEKGKLEVSQVAVLTIVHNSSGDPATVMSIRIRLPQRKFYFSQQLISTILQINQKKRKTKMKRRKERQSHSKQLEGTCQSAPIIAYADLKGRMYRLSGSYPLAFRTPSSAPSLQVDYRFGKGCPMAFPLPLWPLFAQACRRNGDYWVQIEKDKATTSTTTSGLEQSMVIQQLGMSLLCLVGRARATDRGSGTHGKAVLFPVASPVTEVPSGRVPR
ncbi:hypothetical protein V8C43DRAFT_271356 [Trichoderma afarasin]